MIPQRCERCREKLPEGAQPNYVGIWDDAQILLGDPQGRVILWLRCSCCGLLRPTVEAFRETPFDPYFSERSAAGQRAGPRASSGPSPPPPVTPRGERDQADPPWWAAVLGIRSLPPQRGAAVLLVKARWRAAVKRHHVDRGAKGPAHHEAFLAKRAAYEAAQAELGF